MHLSHILLLTGSVIGVMAHPSSYGHAHLHRAVHDKKPGGPPGKKTFVKNIHPNMKLKATSTSVSSAAPSTTSSAAPPPAASSAAPVAAAAVAPGPASPGKYIPFCSEKNNSKAKRVTVEQVHYTGNRGMANGCEWNSNIMLVPNDIADLYTYRQVYTNVAKESYEVVCFNKIGADGGLTGMFDLPNQQKPLRFKLGPGESKTVVTQEDTQAVCAFSPGSIQKTKLGQFAGNWAETDSGNRSNGKWSGADCSSLVAQHYDMDVPGCRICSSNTGNDCSIIKPGGFGINAYTKGMEELDGIGLNIPAGKYTMAIDVGYA